MQRRFYLSLFQHLNVKIFEHWVITMLCAYARTSSDLKLQDDTRYVF